MMGFSWKKLAKSALKIGGKIAKPLLQQTPLGQAVLKGQQALKAAGTNLKAARLGKIEPLSVRAMTEKIAAPLASRTVTGPKKRTTASKGSDQYFADLIGGNGDPGGPYPRARKPAKGKTTVRKGPSTSGKRKPPTGGLNLKALSAGWKAAGKPGTWLGWIKANK